MRTRGRLLVLSVIAIFALVAVWLWPESGPVESVRGGDGANSTDPVGFPPETGSPASQEESTDLAAAIPPPVLELETSPAPVVVDSFEPDAQTALDDWRIVAGSGGHFDVLARVDSAQASETGIAPDAVLSARGWAGEASLGIRTDDVLLVRCGRVVARAQVELDRPDVAEIVHPNLRRSGWQALILAADLPSCADGAMTAFGVLPGSPAKLVRLNGSHSLSVRSGEGGRPRRFSAQEAIDPNAYPLPPLTEIEVVATRANLRRCGSTDCPVVGQIERGTHPAIVVEKNGDWSLISFGDEVGWLFDELYRQGG